MDFKTFKTFLKENDTPPIMTTSDIPEHPMLMGYPSFKHKNFNKMRKGRGKGKWWKKFTGNDTDFAKCLRTAIKTYGGAFVQDPDYPGLCFLNERSTAKSIDDLVKRLGDYKDVGEYNGINVLVNLHTIRRVMERDKQGKVDKIMNHVYRRATKWLTWRKDLKNKQFQPLAIMSKSKVFDGKMIAYYTNKNDMKMLWVTTMLGPKMKPKKTDKTLMIEGCEKDYIDECEVIKINLDKE